LRIPWADGSKKEVKEYLWGYASGVAAATTPDYGDAVLAENTLTFNEGDVTYYRPLYLRTVVTLDQFPIHVTADAAFDFWYVYESVAHREGIAAIPLNSHGHDEVPRDPDGTPYCWAGLRMHPTYQFDHTNGFRAQRFRCPLLVPQRTAETCEHEQFAKGKGCVKDINIEAGVLMRALLDRSGPLYQAVYTQRKCCERINSQAKALGIERPKARNIHSIRRLNTAIYITINAKVLQRARAINASLLTSKLGKIAEPQTSAWAPCASSLASCWPRAVCAALQCWATAYFRGAKRFRWPRCETVFPLPCLTHQQPAGFHPPLYKYYVLLPILVLHYLLPSFTSTPPQRCLVHKQPSADECHSQTGTRTHRRRMSRHLEPTHQRASRDRIGSLQRQVP